MKTDKRRPIDKPMESSRRGVRIRVQECPHLNKKCVLIVGGITKMSDSYRRLVEGLGGKFAYHDGYMRSGERELTHLIKKADIVLCPVDCNSHGACLCVKKICTRTNKSYKMLASSSLSSINKALTDDDTSASG